MSYAGTREPFNYLPIIGAGAVFTLAITLAILKITGTFDGISFHEENPISVF